VGTFKFEFSNPGFKPSPPVGGRGSTINRLLQLPLFIRVGAISFVLAAALFVLLVATLNPNLVPVTLMAISATVPAVLICYLVDKYDTTGISFHTLAITFLAGGTLGIVAAAIEYEVAERTIGGLFLLPIFAGFYEEPAKFLATCWRWRHPKYDRPMDGLILGTVSGLGFAVFETAGYGFTKLEKEGLWAMLAVLIVRSISTPFGHGMWTGIVTAAFWQQGRNLKRAIQSKQFLIACAWAIGLHALWNALELAPCFGYAFVFASALLSAREYRKLLRNKGYRR
jgi:RsiW-degrading membrane proteinase PrsW (M82 family)